MLKKLAIAALVAFAVGSAQAASDPVHQILQRLSKNLHDQARKTSSYALQILNPAHPFAANAITALGNYTQSAARLVQILDTDSVNEELLRDQVATITFYQHSAASALNALGGGPALSELVRRWNQCVNTMRQIKAFVPAKDAKRVALFDALHGR